MNNNKMLMTIALLIVVGLGGFYGGIKYQESKTPKTFQGFNGMRGQGGTNGQNIQRNGQAMRNGFRPVVGDVIASDSKSITVKLQDGSSKIVLLTDTTTVSKTDTGAKTDLIVGSKVGVFGTENSDGSVTAQSVQLNPMFGAFNGVGNSAPGNRMMQVPGK